MNCKEIEQKLSAYIDNELPLQEQAIVGLHVDSCAACSRQLQMLRQQQETLLKLPSVTPSPQFRALFWQKVRTREGRAVRRSLWEVFLLRWIPVPVALSVLIMLFSAATTFSPLVYAGSQQRVRQEVARRAVMTYTMCGCVSQKIFAPRNFDIFCGACPKRQCNGCGHEDSSSCACPG